METAKRIRRSVATVIIDKINAAYGNTPSYATEIDKIQQSLNKLEGEKKTQKSPSVKRIIKGKSKDEIKALIKALQAEI